jgi:hypothetical protein
MSTGGVVKTRVWTDVERILTQAMKPKNGTSRSSLTTKASYRATLLHGMLLCGECRAADSLDQEPTWHSRVVLLIVNLR